MKPKGRDEMNELEVRLAKEADAPFCAKIHIDSWNFAYVESIPREILEKQNAKRYSLWEMLLKNNTDSHYVITYKGTIIGFMTINPPREDDLPPGTYEITGLYLAPEFVGKGCGKYAMDRAKDMIRRRGCTCISLWVLDKNERAKKFYEKNGFKADGMIKASGLGESAEERFIFKY